MTVIVRGRTTVRGKTSAGFTPALDLDFTNVAASGLNPLDKRIQFDRVQTTATGSTVTGSDGKIRNAPHNLLTYSQQFNNAAWFNNSGSVTISANSTTAPDGNITASTIVAGSSDPFLVQLATSSGSVVGSIYAKQANSRYVRVSARQGTVGASGSYVGDVYVDLQTGSITAQNTSGGSTTASVTSVGNSWYRISIIFTSAGAGSGILIQPTNSSNSISVSIGTSSIYLWGAQLEQNLTASYYVPTTAAAVYNTPRFDYDPVTLAARGLLVEEARTNASLYSQDFSNANWTKSNGSVAQNLTSPFNDTTAWTFTESGTGVHSVYKDYSVVTPNTYSVSFYLKYVSRQWVVFRADNITGGSTVNYAWFDIQNGVVGTVNSGLTARITSVGNGWYRCSITFGAGGTGVNTNAYVASAQGDGNTTLSFAGTSAFGIWGSQFEIGSFPTSYIPTVASTVTRNADIAVIGQSDFTSFWTPTTTNLLSYSEQFDNAAWNPTNNNITVSANVIATTDPLGGNTADKIVETTANGLHFANQSLTYATNTQVVFSVYIKAAERSWAWLYVSSLANATAYFDLSNGVIGTLSGTNAVSSSITSLGNGWYRCALVAIATSGTNGSGVGPATANGTNSYTGNASNGIYVWGAQLQTGSTATAYVPTVASSTAAAPVTIYTEFDSPASGNRSIIGIDDNTANNQIRLRTEGTDPYLRVAVGGVEQAAVDAGTVAANTFYKFDAGVNANQFGASIAGGAAVTDTSGTYPTTVNLMRIGTDQSGAYLNGHVRRLRLWRNRLYDSILQTLTS